MLPVESHNEASKVLLHMRSDAPFEGRTAKYLHKHHDQFIANFATSTLKDDVHHWFMMPLHWVLCSSQNAIAYQLFNEYVEIHLAHGQYFSNNFNDKSALAGFTANDTPVVKLQETDVVQLVVDNLFRMPLNVWRNAFKAKKSNQSNLKQTSLTLLVSAGIALITYLSVSSIVLFSAHQISDNYAKSQLDEAANISRERRVYRSTLSKLQSQADTHNKSTHYLEAWEIIIPLMEKDTNVTAVNIVDNTVELFGNAPSATEVLLMIESLPTQNATFLSSIRDDARLNRQTFGIRFELTETAGASHE